MLYDSLGELLRAAAETLYRDVRPEVADDRVRTQLDAMVALANDIGAMWDGIFAGLEHENAILGQALGRTAERPADPLGHHRALVAALNERLAALRAAGTDEALRERALLRSAMAEAAAVQQAVIDRTADRPAPGPARRM